MGTITQRIDDDATESMNEGRGLCRLLVVGVLLAVARFVTTANALFSMGTKDVK